MSEATTSYKKQDGVLALSSDRRAITWTPSSTGASPTVTIKVSEVTNLQQTPASTPKVSIKVVVQRPGAAAADNYVFNFTSPTDARAEQVAITDAIRKALEAIKAETTKRQLPAPSADGPRQSEAMAIAQAVAAAAKPERSWYDDSQLVSDIQLQHSLLDSNPQLKQRFMEALRDKPESITNAQFSTQFWYARVHLLRAHAAEKNQAHGTYNVLSEVKPRTVDGAMILNLSREQVQLIFSQHPLVKRVYDENVPAINEKEFWARFFASRLFKKLKGEKPDETHSTDSKLDKYLNIDENAEPSLPPRSHIPHFMDIEGNEQNHSQRQGNQPDLTMRPNSHDRVPILRILNTMSEKMMAAVAPVDGEPHGPIGMDEETFNQLQLVDLSREDKDNRIRLKIAEQRRLFAGARNDEVSEETRIYLKQDPRKVMATVNDDLGSKTLGGRSGQGIRLDSAIGVDPDSDSEDDEEDDDRDRVKKTARIGGHTGRHAATTQLFGAIKKQHLQSDSTGSGTFADVGASSSGLSETLMASLAMTQNTTVEFLNYFWTVFLSGDPARATEVQRLVETLDKSLDRIKAVATTAEEEREVRLKKARQQIEEYQQRTGRRRKFDPASIKGGAKAVNKVMGPTIRAIGAATKQYRTTLEAQLAQAQVQAQSDK